MILSSRPFFFSSRKRPMATRIQKSWGVSRRLEACLLVDDEVAVVEGLDAEEVEARGRRRGRGRGELVEVVFPEAGIEALDLDAAVEVGGGRRGGGSA
jgi:hypothetical protein